MRLLPLIQEPNKFILQRILEEFLNFCKSKKMEPRLGVSEFSVLKYDKVTLLQVIHMVELYDKYLISCIDGAKDFVIFKRYIHLIFVEFYGIQSIKMQVILFFVFLPARSKNRLLCTDFYLSVIFYFQYTFWLMSLKY